MWWKNKVLLLGICLPLMIVTLFAQVGTVKAESEDTDGFIIEADRVVGSGMTAAIIKQETANSSGKPMLRFQYKSAIIYGMKLTKQINSPNGPVSITLKAKGPVKVTGMTVDTTAISFKGVCIKASETVPELGMEQVVMVAHFMESEDSIIERLVLNTVSGNAEVQVPGKMKILQDLSMLPLNQLDKEIEKISTGHLPLTCEDATNSEGSSGSIGKITDPLPGAVDVVTNPLEPVLDPLEPVLEPLEPVLEPVEPILKPLEPVMKPLEPVLKPLEPVTKTLEPVVTAVTEKAAETVQSVCDRLEDAKGVITKELALDLIDEAITKKIPLNTVCQSDTSLTKELKKWEESLLQSLGLIDLLGKIIPEDPVEQLTKMREKITKEKDGAIIYSP